jgi:transcriptional regulator with XRE-family HTH domain
VRDDGQSEATRAIAARMAELRKARRWSAVSLAEEMTLAGVSWDRYVVSNLERGRRANVTVDELLALAQVFGVPPETLLLGQAAADQQDVSGPTPLRHSLEYRLVFEGAEDAERFFRVVEAVKGAAASSADLEPAEQLSAEG